MHVLYIYICSYTCTCNIYNIVKYKVLIYYMNKYKLNI